MTNLNGLMSSATPEWYTPPAIIERAAAVLGGIDLDPASCPRAARWIPAARFYTVAEDGLSRPWVGKVWLNPPYGRAVGAWVAKLIEEYQAGRTTQALALLAARTETAWAIQLRAWPRCYLWDRVAFIGTDGQPQGNPAFPSAVYALGVGLAAFVAGFADLGDVYALIPGCPGPAAGRKGSLAVCYTVNDTPPEVS